MNLQKARSPVSALPEAEILARTLYGEARNQSVRGMEAVACVIINRVKIAQARDGYWWGRSVKSVCLKPWQFSCWNADDPNREKIAAVKPGDPVFDSCLRIARRAIPGRMKDPTNGATHYHTRDVMPDWAEGRIPCATIGDHLFYNDVD